LASIALVSLLVGGIGIMNIMLVSVTERTREIGVRMALGARRRDILSQFLIESMALAVAGGIVGIGVGVAAAWVMAKVYQWNTLVSLPAVAVSFGFALVVGIFFGIYPARKASRLDPIEALRYE
jgi:putative ABC transport system permease protein